MINCSIGIMAYNEESNIGHLLEALLNQRLYNCAIKEIYIVASGCDDRTEEVVGSHMQKDGRIKLLVQKEREGKASAVNLFLANAGAEILILESGDTIPGADTIEKLVAPFRDPGVGMVGGHPVPVDDPDNFLGFSVNLLWRLHHNIAVKHPKLGELVAFRNIVREIPCDTAVDEASIEAIVTSAGYRLEYAGDAVVYNKGPETISDFLKQRRRIAAGHKYLEKTQGYTVSTSSVKHIIAPFIEEMKWTGKAPLWTIGAVLMEVSGRFMGYYDFHIRKRNPFIWDTATSTKKLKGRTIERS